MQAGEGSIAPCDIVCFSHIYKGSPRSLGAAEAECLGQGVGLDVRTPTKSRLGGVEDRVQGWTDAPEDHALEKLCLAKGI